MRRVNTLRATTNPIRAVANRRALVIWGSSGHRSRMAVLMVNHIGGLLAGEEAM
jgi:hypothetical protein